MTFYAYNEPLWADNDSGNVIGNAVLVYSEADILAEYWDYWLNMMETARERKQPNALATPLTYEEAILDWCVLNWAWKLGSTKNPLTPLSPHAMLNGEVRR